MHGARKEKIRFKKQNTNKQTKQSKNTTTNETNKQTKRDSKINKTRLLECIF